MCGRYASTRTAADLTALFEALDVSGGAIAVDYNVAPTDPVPMIRMSASRGGRVLDVARWGLVPSWATDREGRRPHDQRPGGDGRSIEGVRDPVRAAPVPGPGRRAGTSSRRDRPARAAGGRKQPYFMTPRDGGPVVFGGVWTVWSSPDGSIPKLLTSSIVTTAAVGELADVHDRMPLVLVAGPVGRVADRVARPRRVARRRRRWMMSPRWRSGRSGRRSATCATTVRG